MNKVILGSLLAGGLLFANDNPNKVSSFEKDALRSQSPPVKMVKVEGKRKHKNNRADRVVSDKHTVNAFIPAGK